MSNRINFSFYFLLILGVLIFVLNIKSSVLSGYFFSIAKLFNEKIFYLSIQLFEQALSNNIARCIIIMPSWS